MTQRFVLPTIALAILLTACSLTDAQAQTAANFVSAVEVTGEAVTFKTNDGNYVDITMTVAGPDDFWFQKTFSAKETPRLRLKTEKGYALPDGSYVVEMSARPKVSDKQRAALDKARQSGDRYAMKKMMKEMGLNPAAMVYTAHVGVVKGAFLNPRAEEPAQKGGDGDGTGAARFGAVTMPGSYQATPPAGPPLRAAVSTGLPEFVEASPDAPWLPASFTNTRPDGSPVQLQGFIRPVDSEEAQGPLFEAYFQQAGADGTAEGPWMQEYFEFVDGGVRSVEAPKVKLPPQDNGFFDYMFETATGQARRDIVHCDDVIINCGSLCVGFDCVNGESFGFDTIRMKENNLRLHYDDTSVAASFPRNDWRVYANDSANGGSSYYGVEDATAGRFVFRVFAGARSNALTVDSQGDVGLGTTTPATDIDIKIGDTPTVRLQQDGTSGFTPQTWDMAGNEVNWFVRDATGGSTLPLRIRTGGAPTSSIDIASDGDIGMGTGSPDSDVHIRDTGGTDNAEIILEANSHEWQFRTIATSGDFTYRDNDAGTAPFKIANGAASNLVQIGNVAGCGVGCAAGQVTVDGDILATGTITPDYVFEPEYDLESIEEHAAYMWKNKHLPAVGAAVVIEGKHRINLGDRAQATLEELEKAHIYIEQLHKRTLEQRQTIEQQQQTIEAILARLAAMEEAVKAEQE